MGSGTTGVACKNLNRKFIGIEKTKLILRLHKIELLQSNYFYILIDVLFCVSFDV